VVADELVEELVLALAVLARDEDLIRDAALDARRRASDFRVM
jgi:hypothetical protein